MSRETFEDNCDAGREIAKRGGSKAAGLVMGILAHNAEEAARLDAQILDWSKAERDEWRDRALRAEAELAIVRHRVSGMLYPSEAEIDRWKEDA